MKRTMDATFLNSVANHPEVHPWLGVEGRVDLAQLLADPTTVALQGDTGGFVVTKIDGGRYECHSMFLPEGRGADTSQTVNDAIRYMFTATDCQEIVTKVPASNKAAAGLARYCGFTSLFMRESAWLTSGGMEAVSYQCLTIDRWVSRDSAVLSVGHQFHEELEAAKAAQGSALPAHPDDPAHDRAVGAAVLMAKAGNPRKAVWHYNRWAALAGYASILLLGETPTIIDVRDAVVGVSEGRMEVLLCR